MEDNTKLSLKTKIGFGAGDIFGGGSMIIVGFFYLYFLTDILLIDPRLAGIIFLISKGWDAISDPIMGTISDRTRTRWGRRRPYFLIGSGLVFLSFTMMWYPVAFEAEMARFAYVLAAYLFFSTAYTIVMIPYFALPSELTTDYHERTALSTVRMFFSSASSLFCAVVPLEIVKLFPDQRSGYVVMAITFGLIFSLPLLSVFFFTRERPEFQTESEPFRFKKQFIEPFKTPTFVNFLLMYLFTMATMDIIMSIMMYFMTYYIGRESEANFVLGALLIMQMVALLIFSFMSGRIGKKNAYALAAVWWLMIMLFSFLLKPGQHPAFIYIFAGLVGLGSGGMAVMVYSMMPDVPDVDELYSGKRQEGVYSGLMTFCRKLSSALGIFLVSQVIAGAGFIKPIEKTVDGVVILIKQPQTEQFIHILRLFFAIIPVIALILCIGLAIRYRLTPSVHNRMNALLTARRNGDDYDKAELQSIKDFLENK